MSAEAAEAATFIPEDPDGLDSVVGFSLPMNDSKERWLRLVMPSWGSVNMTASSCRVQCTKR